MVEIKYEPPSKVASQTEEINASNKFKDLPEELSSTFEKFVHQMDLIVK